MIDLLSVLTECVMFCLPLLNVSASSCEHEYVRHYSESCEDPSVPIIMLLCSTFNQNQNTCKLISKHDEINAYRALQSLKPVGRIKEYVLGYYSSVQIVFSGDNPICFGVPGLSFRQIRFEVLFQSYKLIEVNFTIPFVIIIA